MVEKPIVMINFKTYESSTGKKALELAKICNKIAKEEKANIVVCVQPTDIYQISKQVSIPVYTQHVDSIDYGANTGRILPQAVKDVGAKGTLINHSERRLRIDFLKSSIELAKKSGLIVVLCANDPETAEAVCSFGPNYIAVEPPELIGGDISVTSANPEIISESVKKIKELNPKIKVLVGAGIKTNLDFKKSIELGAEGILIASGITKAKNPEKALRSLIQGIY